MKNVEIKFTNDLAKSFGLPENATKGSAGFDLRAIKVLDEQIEMNSDDKVNTLKSHLIKLSR